MTSLIRTSLRASLRFCHLLLFTATCVFAAPDNAQTPPVNSAVTFLYYKDLEQAARFYEQVLGLEKSFDQGWVKMYRMSTNGYVGLVDNEKGSLQWDGQKTVPAMLSFETPDVQRWYKRIKAKAPHTLRTHLKPGEGTGASFINGFSLIDPGGYVVEFFQWREGFRFK